MARKLRGDRILSHIPTDWSQIGPWQVMVCGPARCGGSWIWGAFRMIAGATGKTPCPENGEVDDLRIRNLIGSAWIEPDPSRAWILRTHLDLTELLYGWRIVVVHRDPREVAASIVEGAGAPFEVAMAHLLQTTQLVDTAARLPGSPILTIPWHLLEEDPRAVLRRLATFVEVDPETLDLSALLQRLGHPRDAERLERAGAAELAAMPTILPAVEDGTKGRGAAAPAPLSFSFGFLDPQLGLADEDSGGAHSSLHPEPEAPDRSTTAVPATSWPDTCGATADPPRTMAPLDASDPWAGLATTADTAGPNAKSSSPLHSGVPVPVGTRAPLGPLQLRLLERRFAQWMTRWGYERPRVSQAA